MSPRGWLAVSIGLTLTAAVALIAAARVEHGAPGSHPPPVLAWSTTSQAASLRAPARPRKTRIVAAVRPSSGLEPVGRAFVLGWLACTYHQRACRSIPDTFPAFRDALERQHARSFPTPAERQDRPRVVLLKTVYACRRSATTTATYQDGEGERFQLHLSLINQACGWRVFDVAEVAPHIPLPAALNHGPGRC